MRFTELRKELTAFYQTGEDVPRAKAFAQQCFARMDAECPEDASIMEQKLLQYKVITEEFTPVLFPRCPFYYETGALISVSDGCRNAKGQGFLHAAGWTYERNRHLFEDTDPALWDLYCKQRGTQLYLCGDFGDTGQHFNFNNRPILEGGLKSIYERANELLATATDEQEREFLHGVCESMLYVRRVAEKFAEKAADMLANEPTAEGRENLARIAETAKRVPWEAPQTFYEALNTLAFMRKALGTLEGVGPNTFGRLDMDLIAFYERDIAEGRLTKEAAYDLVCQFLIVWDEHYDHDMPMEGYADHELENTYTLGGCDLDGEPLFNELTVMFLRATREERIIFPKIKCRFSANSPKAYLDEIDRSVINGTSTVMYLNDDAIIPAAVRGGRPIEEARDYLVTGCWSMAYYTEKSDHGSYLNLLKAFELPLHRLQDKMDRVQLQFLTFDDVDSFEELYSRVVENSRILLRERIRMTKEDGMIWNDVEELPLFSSTILDCLENKKDFRRGGARYRDDYLLCFGLPNIVDSLLAIKTLCFDTKKYSFEQMLTAVRANWEGYEDMRLEAVRCHGWGDGNEDSCALANRFNNDLFAIASETEGSYGGRVHIGHLTYTEIRWWGEKTLATPDGRHAGEYFSQGLTPSRLKTIASVTDVINSMAALDPSTMAADNVINIILPSDKINLDVCEAFLRAVAASATMCLQLNCVTKEQLLDAQKNPQNYPDLIVRVCGFSAKFTSLSPGWQDEVLSRNFYEG